MQNLDQNPDQKSHQSHPNYFAYWHQEKLRQNLIAQECIAKARATLPQLQKILVEQFQVTQIMRNISAATIADVITNLESELDRLVLLETQVRSVQIKMGNSPHLKDIQHFSYLCRTMVESVI